MRGPDAVSREDGVHYAHAMARRDRHERGYARHVPQGRHDLVDRLHHAVYAHLEQDIPTEPGHEGNAVGVERPGFEHVLGRPGELSGVGVR